MIWETWLESAALGLNVTTVQAGIIISFIGCAMLLLLVAIATKGREMQITAPLTLLLGILLFVFIGWFPQLLGSILALIMAAFVGKVVIG